MPQSDRRLFIKLAATTLAAANTPFSWAMPAAGARAWVTSKDRRLAEMKLPGWRKAGAGGPTRIQIDSTQRYQEILGFGAAFTDASCYLLSELDPEKRKALLNDLVGPDGLRLSVGRTCIGASDYSRYPYSFDDSTDPDPDLKRFSIEHDCEYILPMLREAQKVNQDLFLFSSPWSPPGWMKASGSLLGGSMRKKYLPAYAQYFLKFLQSYSDEGVKIRALTTQNEIDTDQDGRMPAALWGQEYEIDFIKNHLGPALEGASLDTKIWILDHNYNLWGRVMDELSDPALCKYVDGVAWHGYMGKPEAMARVHEAFPAINNYWTEGGPDYKNPDYATDWAKWSHTFTGILRNWARCIVGWNLVLDEKGRPNIGPFSCGGLVTLDSQTHEVRPSGQYWAIAHFSKLVQRGAHVIGSQGALNDIDHVAFENPDGSRVLVITNQGAEQKVEFAEGTRTMELTLDPGSITTLHW
ncbi:MAG TPA: glycoside hydrolase family 30 protein [Candidatus Acidoferrales bacterium]|jgi:glucosylceramidase|nr:glycoside hydrolase family 30 protein [Candidatus Acidoferrales bacterium]